LVFGAKAPFSFEDLLSWCGDLISIEDMTIIRSIRSPLFSCLNVRNPTLQKWITFEVMLRNELVKVRALRKKLDPAKYMRMDGYPESVYAAHIAINAYRRPSLLDAERTFDQERWRYLDELSIGHYFDLDTLIIYACKLKILEKWDMIESADRDKMLEEALAR
jgi:hypothetical protein